MRGLSNVAVWLALACLALGCVTPGQPEGYTELELGVCSLRGEVGEGPGRYYVYECDHNILILTPVPIGPTEV